MEFVEGAPITEYCDQKQLGVRARIELFRTVCNAVQHAHANLIVHRDLKPSNILVTDDGEVRLLDFGIAKLLGSDSADYSMPVTRTEMRMLTPEYASPEQVRGDRISTSSDVYSLGVLLYELLTGRRPIEIPAGLSRGSRDARIEIEKRILEGQPRKPSTAVVDNAAVSAARDTVGDRLRRELSGDLDNIVLTALRKEPHERYASVEALATDLGRHTTGLPVSARPLTPRYRLAKFVGRNKGGVTATLALIVLLAAFGITASMQAKRIAAERDAAHSEREKAELVSTYLTNLPGLPTRPGRRAPW